MEKDFKELEEVIGYEFKDRTRLRKALTHSSYINGKNMDREMDYERTEYLGDAVLELVTSEYLFKKYPKMTEGEMSKLRARMVCEKSLAITARELGVGEYILLGRGEEKCGGRNKDSMIADVVEAVIGAIYLDSGLESARAFICNHVFKNIEQKIQFYDCKTTLQELVQKEKNHELKYETISESGPDHDKVFDVQAVLDGMVIGCGVGKSKKEAEQNAAYQAILAIKSRKVLK